MKETIIIQKDLIDQLKHLIPVSLFSKVVVLTDHIVKHLYAKQIAEKLDAHLIDFPAGEGSKNRKIKEWIEDELFSLFVDKNTLLITVGGGVVSDMGGFVASTYLRGIKWMSIPTTLMGMIDASIGGKTAINTSYGKNVIGSYYLPYKVMIDPTFLNTLTKEELCNGFAEIIKYGCLYDLSLLQNPIKITPSLIQTCIDIKLRFVSQDLRDSGVRNHLNFGHTIGHALEKLSDYSVPHGQCVAHGILIEGKINVLKGFLAIEDYEKIKTAVYKIAHPLPSSFFNVPLLYEQSVRDKKSLNQQPVITRLERLGDILSQNDQFCSFTEDELFFATRDPFYANAYCTI